MKRALYKLMAPLHASRAIKALHQLEKRLVSRRARFAIPFAYRGPGLFRSIHPRQNPAEIESLYDHVCALEPRRVLEIGTAKGGTLYLWTQAATDDAILVSLDLPGGDFGGGYAEPRGELYRAFARPGQRLHLLRADSHKPDSLEQVKGLFSDAPLDFAFIDGDHTYDGVKRDFHEYGAMVRPGGLIAFHDILPQPKSPETRVHDLWNEIKEHHKHWKFVDHDAKTSKTIGIGLLRVGEDGFRPASSG